MASPMSEESAVTTFAAELVDEVAGGSSRKWALLLALAVLAVLLGGLGVAKYARRS